MLHYSFQSSLVVLNKNALDTKLVELICDTRHGVVSFIEADSELKFDEFNV